MQVSWQQADAMTGTAIEYEDITDGGDISGDGSSTPPSGGGNLEP